MPLGYRYLVIWLTALGVSLAVTPLGWRLGERMGVVAHPGGRRRHRGVVSTLGGVGIAAGFFAALGVSRLLPIPTADPKEARRFWGVVIGSGLIFVVGLLDDRYDLPPWAQYAGYLGAASVAVVTLIILQQFNNPLNDVLIQLSPWLYVPLTLFWMTGMIVTVNWLDALDGLAAGVAAIFAAVVGVHMFRMGQYSVVPLALALLGASLGFLVYNVAPARVFMGSNGAFLLGYVLGALGLIAGARVATVLLVMGMPIVDVAWTIFDRWRHGKSLFRGDRRHLHYRLYDAGFSQRAVVFLYWSVSAFFGILALVISSRLYKLVALGVLGGLIVGLLIYVSRERV